MVWMNTSQTGIGMASNDSSNVVVFLYKPRDNIRNHFLANVEEYIEQS